MKIALTLGIAFLLFPSGAETEGVEGNPIDLTPHGVIIPVGEDPYALALRPDGLFLYVANMGDDTVTVIDTTLNTAIVTIKVDHIPIRIRFAPKGDAAFVVTISGAVSVLDALEHAFFTTLWWEGISPTDLAVAPDGNHLYIMNGLTSDVSLVNLTLGVEERRIAVAGNFGFVVMDPAGSYAYAASIFSSAIAAIDTTQNLVIGSTAVAEFPSDMAVSSDGRHLFVSSVPADTLSVIDTASLEIEAAIRVGNTPRGIAENPRKHELYVANTNATVFSVIDLTTLTLTREVEVGTGITDIATHPLGDRIYLANATRDAVMVIPVP
ncbi:MAG: YncE family protein [Parcubacteria group bacterium]|nr:YncE family protein [Parcubacteria group bacterium]